MTARELMKALDKFEGSSEVIIESLSRKADTGELETKVMGTVDTVTHNGYKVYISTWGRED